MLNIWRDRGYLPTDALSDLARRVLSGDERFYPRPIGSSSAAPHPATTPVSNAAQYLATTPASSAAPPPASTAASTAAAAEAPRPTASPTPTRQEATAIAAAAIAAAVAAAQAAGAGPKAKPYHELPAGIMLLHVKVRARPWVAPEPHPFLIVRPCLILRPA